MPKDASYEPELETQLCIQYYSVVGCCVVGAVGAGAEPWHACANSFHYVGQGLAAPPAPEECQARMTTIIECVIAVGGDSCEPMPAFFEGVASGVTPSGVGPPTDASMPCYAEVLAAWQDGCEPYLY